MVSLKYMPYLAPLLIIEYLLLWVACRRLVAKEVEGGEFVLSKNAKSHEAYKSLLVPGTNGEKLLCFTRTISLLYFFCISLVWHFVEFPKSASYFTIWNIEMITVYFICAVISSFYGLSGKSQTESWVHYLFIAVVILFEVAGSSALFVTVVDFTVLNPHFQFWNCSVHFVTSMCFLVEMALSSLVVKWHHFIFMITWVMTYCIFIWTYVGLGGRPGWPYDFLDMSDATCILVYNGLFLMALLFYSLWYGLGRLKVHICDKSHGSDSSDLMDNLMSQAAPENSQHSQFNI